MTRALMSGHVNVDMFLLLTVTTEINKEIHRSVYFKKHQMSVLSSSAAKPTWSLSHFTFRVIRIAYSSIPFLSIASDILVTMILI